MFRLDTMLMIGSSGSNTGKTALACKLLQSFADSADIIGVKVTTIQDRNSRCPRGGKGCGVCSSLEGNFSITEQSLTRLHKDTAKLLRAGAKRVFWLRVMKEHLQEGLKALLDIIGNKSLTIVESNSLRLLVEPALFIIVTTPKQKSWKASARNVRKYADLVINSNPAGPVFDTSRIGLYNGTWTFRRQAAAIILAGGNSTRAGKDKTMLLVNGRPMIQYVCEQLHPCFDRLIISAAVPDKYRFLGLDVVVDRTPGQGPLMGIASALKASTHRLNFIIAADIPYIDMSLVSAMFRQAAGYDVVIPRTNTHYEPLFALYTNNALSHIEKAVSRGQRRIMDALTGCKVKYIDVSDAQPIVNINTMKDYTPSRSLTLTQ